MSETLPTGFLLRDAGEVDGGRLHAFLERFYGPAKADFLDRHGAWLHRGDENRLVVARDGGEVAAYCAMLPTRVALGEETHPARWWIDLVVAPEFRGRGLQTVLDRRVRGTGNLVLGFPNPLAARIHRKHGWGVVETHRVLICVLDPTALRRVREARGLKGRLLRAAAGALRPLAARERARRLSWRPRSARALEQPDAETLARIFADHRRAAGFTTDRDAAHFTWRYLEAPHRDELAFYAGGEPPRIAAIVRGVVREGHRAVRLLDLFGDLDDRATVRDILGLVARDAAAGGSHQITAFLSQPSLRRAFRAAGFRLGTAGRFCWHSTDRDLMARIHRSSHHWCLGDSDNDVSI